jgi:hypothetical protein
MRGPDRLLCDHTDPREGRGWGKPCPRRVVVEARRHLGDPSLSYSMHFCERHEGDTERKPRCVISQEVRRV